MRVARWQAARRRQSDGDCAGVSRADGDDVEAGIGVREIGVSPWVRCRSASSGWGVAGEQARAPVSMVQRAPFAWLWTQKNLSGPPTSSLYEPTHALQPPSHF